MKSIRKSDFFVYNDTNLPDSCLNRLGTAFEIKLKQIKV
jgi:hypothetical protein